MAGNDTARKKLQRREQGRAKPLNLSGIKFHDALRRMSSTPPPRKMGR